MMYSFFVLMLWALLHISVAYVSVKCWKRFGELVPSFIAVCFTLFGALLLYIDAIIINFIWDLYVLKSLLEINNVQ